MNEYSKKPSWLKKRIPFNREIEKVTAILERAALHTVCEEARCPNRGECYSKGTATILILGRICTRNCGFCAVEHGTTPPAPDQDEPEHVARAVKEMGLRYVVLTSVTRDDLPDGGAVHYARVIRAIRAMDRTIKIEVLVPDFEGDFRALIIVLEQRPDVLNHNMETVPRLYPAVRPQANYWRSLQLLKRSKEQCPQILTKSGLMLGLGEDKNEIRDFMIDVKNAGVDLITIGQYLRPRPDRLPIVRYVTPEEFDELKHVGEAAGLRLVASGPFVRSSYHAAQMFNAAL